jgi:hypothetical protein
LLIARNHLASDSGSYARTTNLNSDEAGIFMENNILVLPAWHLRATGTCPSAGTLSLQFCQKAAPDELIERCWQMLPWAQREQPKWASTRGV